MEEESKDNKISNISNDFEEENLEKYISDFDLLDIVSKKISTIKNIANLLSLLTLYNISNLLLQVLIATFFHSRTNLSSGSGVDLIILVCTVISSVTLILIIYLLIKFREEKGVQPTYVQNRT